MHHELTLAVSRVSARVFLGLSLCRDKEWLGLTRDFMINVLTAGMALRNFPWFVRPFIKHKIPHLAKAQATYPRARELISIVVASRREEQARLGDKYEKPNDALQWAIDMGEPDERLADFQLFLAGVAIHTTSAALTQMMFDICEYPEIVHELRKEIETVMGDSGILGAKSDLHKMKLLDSFMKESQRMNPIQTRTFVSRTFLYPPLRF